MASDPHDAGCCGARHDVGAPEAPPALIDDEIVAMIRQSVGAGDFHDVPPPRVIRHDLRKLLDAGERPSVKENGYDLVGQLVGLDDAGRAQVLLEMFNRATITRVDAGPLQVVAAD